jgi:hypothetical protein
MGWFGPIEDRKAFVAGELPSVVQPNVVIVHELVELFAHLFDRLPVEPLLVLDLATKPLIEVPKRSLEIQRVACGLEFFAAFAARRQTISEDTPRTRRIMRPSARRRRFAGHAG